MQVGRLVLDDEGEQLSQIHYNPSRVRREFFLRLIRELWQQFQETCKV
jgi:hypothetical protein